MKKTIVFGYPEDFQISELIRKNICHSLSSEYEVVNISFPNKFKYKSFSQKLYNFIRKTFLRDKEYKTKLKFQIHEKEINNKLSRYPNKVDFTFLIRPDVYPEYFIEMLRNKSQKFVAYQWDGLNRFPLVYKLIHYFDRFFVFDPADLQQKDFGRLLFTTNFYFDLPDFLRNDAEQKNELYYIGSFNKKRILQIEDLLHKIDSFPINKNIIVRLPKHRENYADKSKADIHFITRTIIRYEDNIRMAKSAKIILEIVNTGVHQGLSFRVFEALCFDKKLITNNAVIKHYEFYKKENIFIIGEDDDSQLEQFINSSYSAVDDRIKQKYSFTNWIKNILDIPPYLPIETPEA